MYKLGTKIRLVKSWRSYSVGAVLEQGFEVDLEGLVRAGIAVRVDEVETPGRPARLAGKAARKIADGAKRMFP